ncbi:MAG: hypothetical protein ACXWVL_02445 [Rhodoplanes sp.]
MSQRAPRRGIARVAMACLFAGLAVCGTGVGPALADDDDELPDVKVLRGIMSGLGLKRGDEAGIDYRERSPLVVPPTTNLPPPENPALAERNPAWPVDPDVAGKKEVAKRKRKAIDWEEEARPLTPAQLDKGVPRSAGPSQAAAKPSEESMNQVRPSELGFKGFSNFRSLFGFEPKPETSTFDREPQRTDLTQPPPGYRTPASSQPYGVSKADARPKPANPLDQAVGTSENR